MIFKSDVKDFKMYKLGSYKNTIQIWCNDFFAKNWMKHAVTEFILFISENWIIAVLKL